jgi:hypothetical protein
MAAISQQQKDDMVAILDYYKAKVNALGLDPQWTSGAVVGDPALSYNLLRREIAWKGLQLFFTVLQWLW